ncbi:unnamed protein product, partial [Nesidiocoris tenuis]
MLLNSLPDSYENFKCAIETRDDFPSVDQLKIKILEQSDSRKERSKASANALMAKKKIQPKRSNEEKPPNSKPFRFKCNFCQKKGHKSSDCDKKKSHNARNTEESQLAFREQALNVSLPKWCIDSGCTSHMCNEAGRFSSVDTSDHTRVNLANNDSTDVNGKGTVKMCVSVNGKKQVMSLHNTLHVPELRSNLLSVGKITDQGLTVTFTSSSAEIKNRSGETLMRAKRTNGLYLVDEVSGSSHSKEEISLKCESKIENWHQRFGHLNESDLKSLQAGKKVKAIDLRSNEKLSDCTICLQGKMTQTPFPKKSSRTSQKLDLIHMDLCGPMQVQSKGGAKYFLTLIDDYSRWCEIRFVKKKSDVFAEFKKFKNLVETQKGRKIKYIQSDNGKEFCNREFDRRRTVNHTPQQNGIAERKNRSLVETARCMLIQSKLAPSFWAEAISTANHIKNRSPSSPINGDTPFKLWNNRIPNVSYFRIFGSTVYFLDKTPQKNKFDPRSKRGTFIGYSDQTKGYRIWLPESKEVIVSRDVKFLNSFSEQNEFEDFISKEIFETEEKTKTVKDNNTTSWTFPDKSQPKKQSCQEPIAFENADQEQGLIDDEQNINDENIDEEDVVIEENLTETIPETNIPIRGRGRPKLVRTGMRGRPRKQYCTKPAESALPDPEDDSILGPEPDFEELAGIADISVKKALAGPDSKGWQEAIKSEISSILENRTFKVFNNCHTIEHWNTAKRVLRYLKKTPTHGLMFRKTGKQLQGFTDADWGNCPDDRRSYTGYFLTLGGAAITWQARKQSTIALSSVEAEYMALTEASKEAVYRRQLLRELKLLDDSNATLIHNDNQGSQLLAKNPIYHGRTKHIDIRHHFVRNCVENGSVKLTYTPTTEMPADILTKPLPVNKHRQFTEALGVQADGHRLEG